MELTCPECHHTVNLSDPPPDRGGRCPNCGTSVNPPAPTDVGPTAAAPSPLPLAVAPSPPGSGAAVASLVFSLLFFIPLGTQLLAVGLGVYALARLRRGQRRRALAAAGLILGLLVAAGWTMLLVSWWPVWMTASGPVYYATGYGPGYGVPADALAQRRQRIDTGLERIGDALSASRRDMGAWPADLEQMVPTYLTRAVLDDVDPEGAPGPERLVTFVADVDPFTDPPERVVAHSIAVTASPDEFGKVGPDECRVLLLNGRVETIDADRLADVLANGYR